ncbi:MAG TPA: 2-oxoacid:acceptor oxidoreductase subunit alpha [Patescibacteria group bacterium]|nr:2-oxoacid:acceptor oxidoreductase subunit alpha [Patescibacteria group bacterium]
MVDIQWAIGGEAGYGIMTTGAMMGKIFTRLGLSVFDYVEYPSLIRGGHNVYYVRGSDETIYSQKIPVDILVALNRNTIDEQKDELTPHAVIIYDPATVKVEPTEFTTQQLFPVPLLEITKQVGADKLMINTVAVGASLALFYPDFAVLDQIMRDAFSKKGEEVVKENIETSKGGFDYVREHYAGKFPLTVTKKPQDMLFIGGAEAVTLGAIKAGVKFAAIYPMTPVNTIMTTLVANALQYSIIVKEPEDEIAGINMAIGAAFAGVRSLAATSGGGFSLMVEGLGLAAQTETPLVIVEGMRPGPSTGMPTWTSQGDLRFVLHASQDDFPRIVLAPGDIIEAFSYTMHAFNLAEKYQMPVIVLVDKYLMEGRATVKTQELQAKSEWFRVDRGKVLTDEQAAAETDYLRYKLTDDGISPRSIPGQKGGIGLSGSDEHDEHGLYNEEANMRIAMMEKRYKKVAMIKDEVSACDLYGPKDAPLTIVGFGSTKLTVLEAMNWLTKEGIQVNFLKINTLYPFLSDKIAPFIQNAKQTLIIEGNYEGQLEGLIRQHTLLPMQHRMRKYDGRPFYPEEIVAEAKKLL